MRWSAQVVAETGRVRLAAPQGAFYLFFSVDGVANSAEAVYRIIDEANVGLAPGTAFGRGGEAFFRLCFLREAARLGEAVDRLSAWLRRG